MRYFQPGKLLKYAVVLLLLWITCSCKGKKIEERDEQGKVIKKYFVSRKDPNKLVGKYIEFYPNGVEKEMVHYNKKGELHGLRVLSYPSGMPLQEEYYEHGNYHGPFRSWFENGKIKQAGKYENNKMTGPWKFYYEEPWQLKEIVTFRDNTENGPFQEFHKNGKLAAEGSYVDELEHGLVKVYDENGRLSKRIMYDHGRPVKYEELGTDSLSVQDTLAPG